MRRTLNYFNGIGFISSFFPLTSSTFSFPCTDIYLLTLIIFLESNKKVSGHPDSDHRSSSASVIPCHESDGQNKSESYRHRCVEATSYMNGNVRVHTRYFLCVEDINVFTQTHCGWRLAQKMSPHNINHLLG